ncbi:MAG: hypothetical protein HYZ16_08125 [Bacteroidetes bacterium]|nr:hypothetical protein [Bacteroidota bacterium]
MAPTTTIGIAAKPSSLRGQVRLPISKSLSNRVLILEHLTKAGIYAANYSDANDTMLMQKALAALTSGTRHIQVGDAGTVARFITALCALTPLGDIYIEGSARMNQRPMEPLLSTLAGLGAHFRFHGQPLHLPFTVHGTKTVRHHIRLPQAQSSQFLSALLLMAPALPMPFTLLVSHDIPSRPYAMLTCSLLSYYGFSAQWSPGAIKLNHAPTTQPKPQTELLDEADWSAAIYFILLAGLVPQAHITMPGLYAHSLQGDGQNMSNVLSCLGVGFDYSHEGLRPKYLGEPIADLTLDCTDCPDLAQPIACYLVAKGCKGELTGLGTLPLKETDRISALCVELEKTGAQIWHTHERIGIDATQELNHDDNLLLHTHNDHRMAMGLSLLLCTFAHAKIHDHGVVSKSFPDYWNQLAHLGMSLIQYP